MSQHKNLVQLENIISTSHNLYIFMEYCNGGDLDKILKKEKRLEEKVAVIYFK